MISASFSAENGIVFSVIVDILHLSYLVYMDKCNFCLYHNILSSGEGVCQCGGKGRVEGEVLFGDCKLVVRIEARKAFLLCNSLLLPSLLLFGLPQKVTKKARAVEADFSLRYNELDRFKKRGTQMAVFC
jgi:hypothetical protein